MEYINLNLCSVRMSASTSLAGTSDVRIVNDVINVGLSGDYSVTLVIVGNELIENNKDFELVFTSDNNNDVFYQSPDMIQSGSLSLTVIDDDGELLVLVCNHYYLIHGIPRNRATLIIQTALFT